MAAQPKPKPTSTSQQRFAERFGDRPHRTHGPQAGAGNGKVRSEGRATARGRDYAMRRR